MSEEPSGGFDPVRLLSTLAAHGVDFIVVGGAAARLHGSNLLTEDLDVTPSLERDNLGRLAAALRSLEARLAALGVPGGWRCRSTRTRSVRR